VTLLKQETLFRVIDAAIAAGLECDALLSSLPREARGSLVKLPTRSVREQYLTLLNQLNEWGATDRREPPLLSLMNSMSYLAGAREEARVFQRAIAEMGRAPSAPNEQGELLFLRTKECYVARGYRVVPPVDAPSSLTFQAWRGTSAVSIIGVAAVATVEEVIDTVRGQLAQLAAWERAEGFVVLEAFDPDQIAQVRDAGLTPVPYSELAPMGVREVTAFVDRQQAQLVHARKEADELNGDAQTYRELRSALREGPVRVVTVTTRNVMEDARRLVLELTRDYLRDPARAAPLLLPLPASSSRLQELVAAAFHEHRVPFSRFDFPGLLAESAFLPVFAVESEPWRVVGDPQSGAAREVLSSGGKVVVVTADEAEGSPQRVSGRWDIPARHVRTFRFSSSAPPSSRTIRSFKQGRALLVGVASYERAQRLPDCVLSDARDLATLLKSNDRCGYHEPHVELLLDGEATAERFRRGLQRLAREAADDDTVIVFFSGHGLREAGTPPEAYLLPVDYDPDDVARTALSAGELTRLLASIRAKRLVVLLDACHAAGAAQFKSGSASPTLKSGLDDKTYEVLGRGAGRVVIASSRADEPSCILPGMKNSLFTTYLLEALGGAAASHDDDVVRVLDVFHHVSKHVPQRAHQHPILKAQEVENNFPIALRPKPKRDSSVMPQRELSSRSRGGS
jgi:metacaspase-1